MDECIFFRLDLSCFLRVFEYISPMQKIFLEHGFELSDEELARFQKFLSLFMEYNSHTNLSAIRDEAGVIEKHFVDSLYGTSIIGESLESINHPRLLDI